MPAEDDIFLAEASPIADRRNSRKLAYVYYKNKISITMCDVSKGVGGGGGGGGVCRETNI